MKFEFQKIIKFMGRIEDWQKWKLRTECAFFGPSYDRVLPDALFTEKNQHMNKIFY